MNTTLFAGQQIPITPEGNWLYLKSAQADIDIYRQETGERVTLGKSSVFNVGEGKHLGRLLIASRTDNQIEIQFGYGTFTPPVEGQSVVIQSLPNVNIDQLPPVELAANQQLAVSSLPAMEFKSAQPVDVKTLPSVTIDDATPVNVTQPVSATLTTEAVTVFPHNIAPNPARRSITIKASKGNANPVLVDAFELDAGERITIASTADMTLSGVAGDGVTIMEI